MVEEVRNAVRCFIFDNNKIVAIRYLKNNIGYYDIPGGKIEKDETAIQALNRECLEETSLKIINPIYRGIMHVNYPNRKFNFKIYITTEYLGKPDNFDENISEWIEIDMLLKQEKRFPITLLLENKYKKYLLNKDEYFEATVDTDINNNIISLSIEYSEKLSA